MGDLAVVEDFFETVMAYLRLHEKPDVIFIPKSFIIGNGFDILGRSYREIERLLRIKVELINCFPIFD